MHMVVSLNDGVSRAVPLFGLNAPDTLGVLMVSARTGSDTTVVAVLPFAPDGAVQSDQSIIVSDEPTGLAIAQTTLVAEGGFCFDGIPLSDVQYLYVEGGQAPDDPDDPEGPTHNISVVVDVSFVPNRLPVRSV